MLEFEHIHEVDVTYGNLKVLKKVNDTKLLVQCHDQTFLYQKDDLEHALFCIISGHPIILCFRKFNMELIRCENSEFIIEFTDDNCVYLHHDDDYIYMFSNKIGRYLKYGSHQNCTQHDCLYVNQRCSQLYISEDYPEIRECNLGILESDHGLTILKGQDEDLHDVSHLTLVVKNDCYYIMGKMSNRVFICLWRS